MFKLPAELNGDPLAVRCKLDVQIINDDHYQHLKQVLIQTGEDGEDTFHTIEVINNTCNPNVVKYYRGSVDISRLENADFAVARIVSGMRAQVEEGKMVADNYLNGIVDSLPAK